MPVLQKFWLRSPCILQILRPPRALSRQVYGSGVIADEGDDFAAGGIPTTASAQAPATEAGAAAGEGGSNGAGGSSGGAAPEAAAQEAQPQGMRLYLSQIRDWFVECSCDMIFICVRTDVATYRLVK